MIVVSPGSLPEGEVGEAYSETFHRLRRRRALHLRGHRRARRAAVAAAVAGLPPGLTLSSDGLLSGTPAEAGEFSFTVTATDANGEVGRKAIRSPSPPPPGPILARPGGDRPDRRADGDGAPLRHHAAVEFHRRLEDLRREGRAGGHNGIRLDTGDSMTACPTPEPTEPGPSGKTLAPKRSAAKATVWQPAASRPPTGRYGARA